MSMAGGSGSESGRVACAFQGEEWDRVVRAVERVIPGAKAVVLYGSGNAGRRGGGDYDVLVVVEDKGLVRERARLNRLLGEAAGLKTDLNLATPAGLRLRRLIDPYVQHCLATGMVAAGDLGDLADVPPLSAAGARDALASAKVCLREQAALRGAARREMLEFVAKHLAALEQALSRRFDRGEFRQKVRELLVGSPDAAAARLVSFVAELEEKVRALPPNESDREAALLAGAGVGRG